MDFVLDASITLSWCFSDEATPKSMELLSELEYSTAYVPNIWSLEVGNVLLGAGRKKRISNRDISIFISLLEHLNIEVDNQSSSRGFHEILAIANTHSLTTYDAAYLELALRLNLPLATKDDQLGKVATVVGIQWLN